MTQTLIAVFSNPFIIAALVLPIITGIFMVRAVITCEVKVHYINKKYLFNNPTMDLDLLPDDYVMTWHPKHWLKWNLDHWSKWIDKQKSKG